MDEASAIDNFSAPEQSGCDLYDRVAHYFAGPHFVEAFTNSSYCGDDSGRLAGRAAWFKHITQR